jgi:sulfatase modifying factor 1
VDKPAEVPEVEPKPKPPRRDSLVELVAVDAGSFHMGSPDDERGRYVYVSAFECMRFPVTRRIYAEVIGKDPGWPKGPADERPVNQISWFDAIGFCNRLSERKALTPCYSINGKAVSWKRYTDGYRLPTEAEWEYACRAGTHTHWSFGDDEERIGEHAWYKANSEREPQPVGGRKPNAWDLHDMHGNVYEWCWDWWDYSSEVEIDLLGLTGGLGRVLRGGSFADPPRDLRSTFRDGGRPVTRHRRVGFRCVRGLLRQP